LRIKAEETHIDVQLEKIRDQLRVSTDGYTSNERYENVGEENEPAEREKP
jgi:hypothetical protein